MTSGCARPIAMLCERAMRRVASQLLALLTAVALLGQVSGLANALEFDAQVHCCCGDHEAAHACGCANCKGHGTLRWRAHRGPLAPASPMPTLTSCHGRRANLAVPWVPALPPPPRLLLAPITSHDRSRSLDAPPLLDRLVDAARPPP